MKKILFSLILPLLFFTQSYASHLLGADLVYECLGPGQYRVTLALYRDCNGINAASAQTLSYSSATCNVNGSVSLSRVGNPVDITPLCPGEPSACSGNGQWGIERHIYQGVINLPPGCGDDWILGWSQCCRNDAINTLSGASSQDMYVGAVLDNTVTAPVCNTSPVFNNPPGSIVCVNQPVVYNHGVSDANGDSLYFTLGNCFEANGNTVNYAGGYSGANPLSTASGITVDPNTGAIAFTPNQQQVGVLCINVKEYRNGVLIGEINRDMQFTVINCSNQPPVASGVNGSSSQYDIDICANGTLCFDINGSDPNTTNNLNMSWNNEIPAGTFTVSNNGTPNPTAEFCWTPSVNDIGTHFFTVNIQDDACPIIGSGTYTYTIEVLPSPNTLTVSPNDTVCLGESTTLVATATPAATSYSWTPATGLSSTTGASVTASPVSTTTYEVTASFPDGCDLTEIVTVGVAPNPNVSVTPANSFNCSGQSTVLEATQSGTYSYSWTPGPLPTTSSVTVSPAATTTYTVTVTESNFGCTATASGTVVIAAPTGDLCNVLYVTPTGTPTNDGTKTSPLDLITAMEKGACNGTTIKMAVGDYVTDSAINRVTSYLTLEGGFDPSINWDKISTTGATRILRTATQSYSTATSSLVLGNGITDETGPNPEVVAISVANQTGFRFQDITIENQLTNPGTQFAGYEGVDVIGVRLNACDDYNIVRTQVLPGVASPGADQIFTIPATDGGNSIGVQVLANGANGNIINSAIFAGTAGAGGTGTPAGTAGAGTRVSLTGTALTTNDNNFNLSGQPVITMDDIACTATNIDFTQTNPGAWTFGSGSTPGSANGSTVTTLYNTIGRKDVSYAGNPYAGFANILLDAQVIPTFTTTAPFVNGQYRICAGQSVDFTATNGGVGYTYVWDLGGGSTPNTYNGVAFETLLDVEFSTPGVYTIQLNYETNCCGLSLPATLEIYVEERPVPVMPADATICDGAQNGETLTVGGMLPNGTITWSPSAGLNVNDSSTVISYPSDTTVYNVVLSDSTGLCTDFGLVQVNVVDLDLSTTSTPATCGPDGTATVVVTGGSGDYSYLWNDDSGQTTSTATGLQVGNYTVVVTDNIAGCSDSVVAVVNPQAGSLVGFISATSDVSCIGAADGQLTVSVNGGQAPFSYSWSPAGGSLSGTLNTSHTTSLLPGGTYTVTITDDLGCEYIVDGFIAEPDSLRTDIDSLINPTCQGATDGSLAIFADGGNAPLTITWDDANSTIGREITNVGVGDYEVTIVDQNGCSDSMSFTLVAPLLTDSVFDTICYQEAYTLPSGDVINPSSDTSSIDSLINAIGCDSIVSTFLVVAPEITGQIDTTICFGESILVNGNVYDTTVVGATEVFTGIGPLNCDSTVTINLVVTPSPSGSIDTTLCFGETITINGNLYDTTTLGGQEIIVNPDPLECDSVVTVNLTILPEKTGSIDTTLCFGDSIIVNGTVYNTNTIGAIEIFNVGPQNCDSTVTINLTIVPEKIGLIDTTVCFGESILVNGNVYDTTVTGATEVFTNIGPQNCDSTVTINLNVLPELTLEAVANPDSIFPGDNSVLEAISNGTIFEWDNNQSENTITVSPLETTSYNVVVTDSNGCVSESSVTVYILGLTEDQLMIPDAFTPNGDNNNDIFRVVTRQYFSEINMSVFNRWGDLVHRESGPVNHGWDGKYKGEDQPVDVYSYIVTVTTLDDQEFIISGTVSLFR